MSRHRIWPIVKSVALISLLTVLPYLQANAKAKVTIFTTLLKQNPEIAALDQKVVDAFKAALARENQDIAQLIISQIQWEEGKQAIGLDENGRRILGPDDTNREELTSLVKSYLTDRIAALAVGIPYDEKTKKICTEIAENLNDKHVFLFGLPAAKLDDIPDPLYKLKWLHLVHLEAEASTDTPTPAGFFEAFRPPVGEDDDMVHLRIQNADKNKNSFQWIYLEKYKMGMVEWKNYTFDSAHPNPFDEKSFFFYKMSEDKTFSWLDDDPPVLLGYRDNFAGPNHRGRFVAIDGEPAFVRIDYELGIEPQSWRKYEIVPEYDNASKESTADGAMPWNGIRVTRFSPTGEVSVGSLQPLLVITLSPWRDDHWAGTCQLLEEMAKPVLVR